ncbi:hypothetical protein SH661x_003899 [Planctomicrobium sp. SH661]|uniref:hypothetical protein n=1 Tax=Planctomicrobium sp. SH661 TaxID=3448124 RepID=UPI003F5C810C
MSQKFTRRQESQVSSVEELLARRRERTLLTGACLVVFMIIVGVLSVGRTPAASDAALVQDPSTITSTVETASTTEDPAPPDQFRDEQILGRWLRNGSIRREIVIQPGGTATMNVQLDYLSALIYGKEMNLELSWELKDNILSHTIVSGTPKANVDRLSKDFGNSLSYRVIRADDQELVLQSLGNDKKLDRWIAVK